MTKTRVITNCYLTIWNNWQNDSPLNYKGDYYNIDFMTPFFNPGPINTKFPKIILAAVNKNPKSIARMIP